MTLGQIAYEAYLEYSGGKSLISGAPLPKWQEQAEAICQAWEAAGEAVLKSQEIMARNHLADRSIEERLWAKTWIDESHIYNGSPCWRWTGGTWKGYGAITVENVNYQVHRLSASIHLGLDLSNTKLQVCHHCDVKDCWNPGHLFLGSNSRNQRDSVNKKRSKNSKKTHCKKGHPYDIENTEMNNRGQRVCKACHREKSRIYQLSKKNSLNKELVQ